MNTRETPLGTKLSQDKWFAYNTLTPVFHYIEADDLKNVVQVCKMWQWIIKYDESIVTSKTFATCETHLASMVETYGDKIKSIEVDGLARATPRSITKILRKLPNLKKILLADCRLQKLDQLIRFLDPDIKGLQIEQTHKEFPQPWSLNFVSQFPNLTYLGILTFSRIEPQGFEALKQLTKLTHLFLYDGCEDFPFDYLILRDLTGLRVLQLGGETSRVLNRNIDYLKSMFKNLVNLYKIKLEIYPDWGCNYNFFHALSHCSNVTELELHGEILNKFVGKLFIDTLSLCTNIKVLTIEMEPEYISTDSSVFNQAIRNTFLYRAVRKLKNSLRRFYWLVPPYTLKCARAIWGRENCILFQQCPIKAPICNKDIRVTHIKKLEKKLGKDMPNTLSFVLVQNYGLRYCPKCRTKN